MSKTHQSKKPSGVGCDTFDPNSLNYEQALEKILAAIPLPSQTKQVKLRKALGRVLAQDIKASYDVPNHTNSAMDGYAIDGKDLDENGLGIFELIGSAFAGQPFSGEVYTGQAVKIMTGAVMPKGADTVIMQEYIELINGDADAIELNKAASKGQNVRYAGEDIAKGSLVFKKGCKIGSAHLGVLASMGISKLSVYRKPRVAFFSNGDEICAVGKALKHGDVYDSNRHTLYAMLNKMGVKAIDLGLVGDDYDQIKAIMEQGNQIADMVITSAGASVGEADYIYDVLSELGKVEVWKIAIKPGRPLSFGTLSSSVFFGLPGNSVSVMTSFGLCVKPAIEKLCGTLPAPNLLVKAKTLSDIRKRAGRSEYQRAWLSRDDDELIVDAGKYQGSGVLTSMSKGNCFVVLDLESKGVKAGEWVDILMFSELF